MAALHHIYIYIYIYGLEVLISMQECCMASEFDNLDLYLGFTSSLLIMFSLYAR